MFNEYEKIIIKYEQINELQLIYNKPFLLTVEWNNVQYELFVRLNQGSTNLLVFGSGAYDTNTMKPPIFHRHSWTKYFDDSIIFYNDPTLYLDQMSIGWGHGSTETFYLEKISCIIEIIMKRIEIEAKKVLFYGSSGGGFMSLILAGFIKDSVALVNNPQTIITNYYQTHVNRLLEASHPSLSKGEAIERFSERLNVIEFYKKIKYVPEIHYLQNISCEHDMHNHVNPFISGLKMINEDIAFNPIHFEFYFDKEKGHNPLGLEETIHYINETKTKM